MTLPILNEQERHILSALLSKKTMTHQQLSELCRHAFGWSNSMIRRTQKSLLKQGLITLQDGMIIPTVTKEVLGDSSWNQLVGSTFEWVAPAQPVQQAEPSLFRNIWFWCTCAGVIVIGILLTFLLTKPPVPEIETPIVEEPTIPEELLVCKEALDKWQSHDIYYMEHTQQYPSPSITAASLPLIYNWYYVHEEDWMHLSADWNNPDDMNYPSYMYRDGELLHAPNLKNEKWGPILHLSTTPDPDDYSPTPWPMTFTWENCELYHKKTLRYNYGSRIYCLIIDHTGEVPKTYEVEFALDNFKNLYYIEVITCDHSNQVCVESYVMKNTDPDMIAEAIAHQGNDDPVDNEPALDSEIESTEPPT